MIIGIVAGVIALLVVGGFSINWFSNSDCRAAMKSADSYLVAGKYGDAEEQYKKAHELNATDKSLKYYDYAQELGQAWIKRGSRSMMVILTMIMPIQIPMSDECMTRWSVKQHPSMIMM